MRGPSAAFLAALVTILNGVAIDGRRTRRQDRGGDGGGIREDLARGGLEIEGNPIEESTVVTQASLRLGVASLWKMNKFGNVSNSSVYITVLRQRILTLGLI